MSAVEAAALAAAAAYAAGSIWVVLAPVLDARRAHAAEQETQFRDELLREARREAGARRRARAAARQ